MAISMDLNGFVTPKQVATLYGIDPKAVATLANEGRLEHKRVGARRILIKQGQHIVQVTKLTAAGDRVRRYQVIKEA